jgi:hypothetical protein
MTILASDAPELPILTVSFFLKKVVACKFRSLKGFRVLMDRADCTSNVVIFHFDRL